MGATHDDALASRLDELLSLRQGQREHTPRTAAAIGDGAGMERELQPLLVTAGRLDALREARPGGAFADALEVRLLRYAQSIQPLNAPTISRGEGAEDMTLAAADAPTAPILPSLPTSGAPYAANSGQAATRWPVPQREAPRLRSTERTGLRRLPGAAWGALAAVVLLTCTLGLFTVAASAAPGSALYGLRRFEQTIQSQLTTDPAARVRLHLANATDALRALDQAATRHDSAAYDAAFATLRSEDADAQSALAQVTSSADHTTLQNQLDSLHTSEQQHLSADLPLLTWAEQVRTTTALGALGVAAPVVTNAQITAQGVTQSSGHGDGSTGSSNGSAGDGASGAAGSQPGATHGWLVTLYGAGFVAGAQLMVDGQPIGQTLSVTPTTLVATVDTQDAGALNRATSIGLRAPNGEAAETTAILRSVSGTPQSPTSTPTALPTATPPGSNHKHGKGGH